MEYKHAALLMSRVYRLSYLLSELLDLPESNIRGRYRVYRAANREIGLLLAALRRL